jgi:hypothetical protein
MKKIYTCLLAFLSLLSLDVSGQCPGQAVILTPSSDLTFCSNDSIMFQAAAGNGYTYSWLFNNNPIAGAMSQYYFSGNYNSGSYRVIVTNGSGCIDTSVARTLTVFPSPNISISYPPIVCPGIDITLTPNVTGAGPFTYQWSSGSVTSAFTFKAESNVQMTLTVTDINYCTASQYVGITVDVQYTDAGNDVSICPGSSTQLMVKNNSAMSYNWSPAIGLDDPASVQPIASPAATTTYIATVSSYSGCTSKDTVIVNVTADPKISITKRWTNIDTLCRALYPWDSLMLQASIQGSYKWYRNGGLIETTPDYNLLAFQSGSYTAEYTGGICGTAVISDPYIIPGCEDYGQVSGNVFNDKNGNGIREAGENGLPDIWILAGPRYGVTDSLGNYLVYVNPGSHSIDVLLTMYAHKTFPFNPSTYLIDVPAQGTSFFDQKDFGITKDIVKDLGLTVVSGFARPGFDQTTWLYLTNNGTELLDATVVFNYDPTLTYISSNPSGTHNSIDHTITFNVASLTTNLWLTYEINFNVPVSTPLSSWLTFFADGTINGTDAYPSDNLDSASVMVRGSYDPNDKAVYPVGVGSANYIHSSDKMEYTIRFQNTGNASAIMVAIKDTIDSDLDLSTFEMLAKSHACTISIDSSRIITWTFNNINLPDSTSDEKGSHGFIKYSLKQNSGNTAGTVINNLAYIYFDFNPPVLTNQVSNTVDNNYFATGTKNSIDPAINQIKVYPNPAKDQVFISSAVHLDFRIMDLTGKQVFFGQTNTMADVSILQKGLYLLKLESNEGVYVQKLVIE